MQSDGWIKAIGISSAAPWAFFPIEVGGSETTYIPDYAYCSSGWRVLLVGGNWYDGGYAGLFYFGAYYSSSDAYSFVGARLLFHPYWGTGGRSPRRFPVCTSRRHERKPKS